MKSIHGHEHLLRLGRRSPFLALRPCIDHRVENISIGTQICMTNGIRLMQLHHVRQQGIRPSGGIAVHALGKRVDDGAVGDHIGLDAEVALIVHQVHALEEVLGLLCRAFGSGFGVGVNDHIVGNGIGLHRRISLAVHLNHILENPMSLGRRLLGTGLGIGMNHGVERVFVGANVQIFAALFAKLFHPGENLFGACRCHFLAAPGPCIDHRVKNARRRLERLVPPPSRPIQTIHPLQKRLRPPRRRSPPPALGPRIHRHGIHPRRGMHPVRILRIVLVVHAIQPMFHHPGPLRGLLLGPSVHDGGEGQDVGIESSDGCVVEGLVHGEEPFAFLGLGVVRGGSGDAVGLAGVVFGGGGGGGGFGEEGAFGEDGLVVGVGVGSGVGVGVGAGAGFGFGVGFVGGGESGRNFAGESGGRRRGRRRDVGTIASRARRTRRTVAAVDYRTAAAVPSGIHPLKSRIPHRVPRGIPTRDSVLVPLVPRSDRRPPQNGGILPLPGVRRRIERSLQETGQGSPRRRALQPAAVVAVGPFRRRVERRGVVPAVGSGEGGGVGSRRDFGAAVAVSESESAAESPGGASHPVGIRRRDEGGTLAMGPVPRREAVPLRPGRHGISSRSSSQSVVVPARRGVRGDVGVGGTRSSSRAGGRGVHPSGGGGLSGRRPAGDGIPSGRGVVRKGVVRPGGRTEGSFVSGMASAGGAAAAVVVVVVVVVVGRVVAEIVGVGVVIAGIAALVAIPRRLVQMNVSKGGRQPDHVRRRRRAVIVPHEAQVDVAVVQREPPRVRGAGRGRTGRLSRVGRGIRIQIPIRIPLSRHVPLTLSIRTLPRRQGVHVEIPKVPKGQLLRFRRTGRPPSGGVRQRRRSGVLPAQGRRRRRRSGGAGIDEGARLANGSPEGGAGGEVVVGVGGVGGAEGGGRGGEGGGGVLVGVVAVGHGLFAGYCVGGLSAVLRALVDGMETSGCTFTHGPVMMGDDGRRWTMTIDR
mmetsp:Transcript_2417/g.4911  ORF Transcript_2417/g.4911 Transcript_2417/m.4911 type:complete len:978 (-) Transcript_2417:371-3304(-)